MEFAIVELNDGGAQSWPVTRSEAFDYLRKSEYWQEAAEVFIARNWVPGDMMSYPCGWIFCVTQYQ